MGATYGYYEWFWYKYSNTIKKKSAQLVVTVLFDGPGVVTSVLQIRL